MRVGNEHERRLNVLPSEVGRLLDTLGSPNDRLWPHRTWPPLRLDKPLAVGSVGGHGPIRYRCVAYEPGRRVEFEFISKGLSKGLQGRHAYWVEQEADGSALLRHTLHAKMDFMAYLRWLLIVRPLHDALVEDSLDKAQLHLRGKVARDRRWSARVRLLRRALGASSAGPTA